MEVLTDCSVFQLCVHQKSAPHFPVLHLPKGSWAWPGLSCQGVQGSPCPPATPHCFQVPLENRILAVIFPAWQDRNAGGFPRAELSQHSGDEDVAFCPCSTGGTQSQQQILVKPPGTSLVPWLQHGAHPPGLGHFHHTQQLSWDLPWDLECAASSVLCSASLDGDTRSSDMTVGKVIPQLAWHFVLSHFCHLCFQIILHSMGILLLTKFILGGCLQFCFSSFRSQSSPLLDEIHTANLSTTPLNSISGQLQGPRKKYPKHRRKVRGAGSPGIARWEKPSLGMRS